MRGKIGDLSFYKDRRLGYQVRMKGGPTADQIKNDPRFRRTKENGQEFGRAANASKMLRRQLFEQLRQFGDKGVSHRINARMVKVLQADVAGARGERQILTENLPMLIGIECNIGAQLSNVLFLKARPHYDRATGTGGLELPAFLAKNKVLPLEGASHVQIQVIAIEFDPADPSADGYAIAQSSYIDVGTSEDTAAQSLSFQLQPQAQSSVLILMGITYYQWINEGYYPLFNGQYNSLTIVDVDIP